FHSFYATFSFFSHAHHRYLHSFPTRRSSDLNLLDYPAVRGIVINWRDVGERKRAEHERAIYMRDLAEARDTALAATRAKSDFLRSEEHTSELQSRVDLVCRLLLEKKKKQKNK